MPSLDPQIAIALWARACEAEIGIAVRSKKKSFLKSELYRIRQESGNPEFEKIIICDPKGDEIFMCKKTTELD